MRVYITSRRSTRHSILQLKQQKNPRRTETANDLKAVKYTKRQAGRQANQKKKKKMEKFMNFLSNEENLYTHDK